MFQVFLFDVQYMFNLIAQFLNLKLQHKFLNDIQFDHFTPLGSLACSR